MRFALFDVFGLFALPGMLEEDHRTILVKKGVHIVRFILNQFENDLVS